MNDIYKRFLDELAFMFSQYEKPIPLKACYYFPSVELDEQLIDKYVAKILKGVKKNAIPLDKTEKK